MAKRRGEAGSGAGTGGETGARARAGEEAVGAGTAGEAGARAGEEAVGAGTAGEAASLVVALGASPAIVTETIYALLVPPSTLGVPALASLHVLTTSHGRALLEAEVLGRGRRRAGALAGLVSEWSLEGRVPGSPEAIEVRVPSLPGVGEIADVRTEAEARAFEELCCEVVAERKARGERVHACIAGGRKSMGAQLALAMTLYGDARDAMSHTLVEPESLEQDPEFFFPRRRGKHASAIVRLVPIPFVRTRSWRTGRRLEPPERRSHVTAMRSLSGALGVSLVALEGRVLVVESHRLALRPTAAALLGGFLHLKARCPEQCGELRPGMETCPGCFRSMEALCERGSGFVRAANVLAGRGAAEADWITPERIRSEVSRVKHALEELPLWQELLIPRASARGGAYGLAVASALVADPLDSPGRHVAAPLDSR